ncbi:ATP-dependent DNA helicase PIF1, partial [Trachymyrmex zeteki]
NGKNLISAVAMMKIHELLFELIDHPPYSPDLAPSDFFLFPRLKVWLGGQLKHTYQGLIDYIQNMAFNVNGRIGKIIILPSTFIGSPRNMLQNYQDAMAIVDKFGKPNLFITMTCNPNWREIVENLLPFQQALDRSDICARVFNIKKNYLIDLIVKQKFFGEVAAYVYVIEFQKRGLPHVHILITLKQNYKITTVNIVDKYISAETPDPPYCPKLSMVFNCHINIEIVSSIKSVKYLYKYIYFRTNLFSIYISPTQLELFHLRLLLLTIKGATSFQNLKVVNGETHQTFPAACLALGLIEDDEEWNRAMNEAVKWMMPQQLRRLFSRILIHCNPLYPEKLWESFKDALSEDYVRNIGMLYGFKKAYIQINNMLLTEGKSFAGFSNMEQLMNNDDVTDGLTEQESEIGLKQYEQLNDKQKEIVDIILDRLDNNSINSHCFYIDGPGGSGKIFIYTTIYYLAKIRNKRVYTMAFTGIAATLLPYGKTDHKTFGLPVPLFVDSTSAIKIQSKEAKYLKEIDIFILDEAPMAPRYALEIMDRTLRDITDNNLPFGGKIIILGGDFRQLLPKTHSTRSEIVNLSIKFSSTWKYFEKFSLSQNMRVLSEEPEFANFLLDLGDGNLNDSNNNIQIPQCCIASPDTDIVADIYGDLIKKKDFLKLANFVILSARNTDVEEINKRVVELLDSSGERIYTSIDSIVNSDGKNNFGDVIIPEYLNNLSPSCLPPHELRLRPNSVIMLIRNLSINEGLCNGTRLIVVELANHLLKCKILTGDKTGEIVFLNRITLYCENIYPFTFSRRQFPIKLAFAMTINKSQGQTFDKVRIDLRKDVFNHGQLYVVFSRVRTWQALKVFLDNQRENQFVKNYVFKELFA